MQNYLLTTEFLSRIESLCPTLGRLERLRAHPPYQALLRRFQLPVYFQLRFKESVAAVERAFELGQASGGATASSGFVMSESESVWNAVERVWADEVWLEELAGKFWRLTLQVRHHSLARSVWFLSNRARGLISKRTFEGATDHESIPDVGQ